MAGKVIVYGFKTVAGKTNIMLDSEFVGEVKAHEKLEIPVSKNCEMTCKCGFNKGKGAVSVKDGMQIEVQLVYSRLSGKITMEVLKEEVYDASNDSSDTQDEKPVYEIKGARGRYLKVFEDKCIITTKAGVGSFLTGNVSDGEKTIYYSDVLGVQFKRCGLQLGYLQLETGSTTMNNNRFEPY